MKKELLSKIENNEELRSAVNECKEALKAEDLEAYVSASRTLCSLLKDYSDEEIFDTLLYFMKDETKWKSAQDIKKLKEMFLEGKI